MSNEIIYEDDTIIVYGEYKPASHIYDNDEINLNIKKRSMIKVKLHECRNNIAKYNNALQTADVDTLRNECLLLCLALKNLQVMNDNENKFDEGGTIIVRAESDPASHIYDNDEVNLNVR